MTNFNLPCPSHKEGDMAGQVLLSVLTCPKRRTKFVANDWFHMFKGCQNYYDDLWVNHTRFVVSCAAHKKR